LSRLKVLFSIGATLYCNQSLGTQKRHHNFIQADKSHDHRNKKIIFYDRCEN